MKNLSEATPREILDRIEFLDRKFNRTKSVVEARHIAKAISILVEAHKKAVIRKMNTPFELTDKKLVK